LTHIGPFSGPTVKIWNFSKFNMAAAAILKSQKVRDISPNVLADHYEIGYAAAKWVLNRYGC